MVKYQVNIGGYGGEVVWKKLTTEQYRFWQSVDKTMLDRHILGSNPFDDSEDETESDLLNNIPDYAVLRREGEDWYDLDDGGKEYYCSLGSSWLNVVRHDKNSRNGLVNVCSIDDLASGSGEGNLDIMEHISRDESEELSEDFYLQIFSSEKGTFISAGLELQENEEFDIGKLRIYTCEALNEQDERIESISYNGQDLDSYGAETRGKGIDIYLVEM
jgi:hypothetical protein